MPEESKRTHIHCMLMNRKWMAFDFVVTALACMSSLLQWFLMGGVSSGGRVSVSWKRGCRCIRLAMCL